MFDTTTDLRETLSGPAPREPRAIVGDDWLGDYLEMKDIFTSI